MKMSLTQEMRHKKIQELTEKEVNTDEQTPY